MAAIRVQATQSGNGTVMYVVLDHVSLFIAAVVWHLIITTCYPKSCIIHGAYGRLRAESSVLCGVLAILTAMVPRGRGGKGSAPYKGKLGILAKAWTMVCSVRPRQE